MDGGTRGSNNNNDRDHATPDLRLTSLRSR
jgi:hypothetical protein